MNSKLPLGAVRSFRALALAVWLGMLTAAQAAITVEIGSNTPWVAPTNGTVSVQVTVHGLDDWWANQWASGSDIPPVLTITCAGATAAPITTGVYNDGPMNFSFSLPDITGDLTITAACEGACDAVVIPFAQLVGLTASPGTLVATNTLVTFTADFAGFVPPGGPVWSGATTNDAGGLTATNAWENADVYTVTVSLNEVSFSLSVTNVAAHGITLLLSSTNVWAGETITLNAIGLGIGGFEQNQDWALAFSGDGAAGLVVVSTYDTGAGRYYTLQTDTNASGALSLSVTYSSSLTSLVATASAQVHLLTGLTVAPGTLVATNTLVTFEAQFAGAPHPAGPMWSYNVVPVDPGWVTATNTWADGGVQTVTVTGGSRSYSATVTNFLPHGIHLFLSATNLWAGETFTLEATGEGIGGFEENQTWELALSGDGAAGALVLATNESATGRAYTLQAGTNAYGDLNLTVTYTSSLTSVVASATAVVHLLTNLTVTPGTLVATNTLVTFEAQFAGAPHPAGPTWTGDVVPVEPGRLTATNQWAGGGVQTVTVTGGSQSYSVTVTNLALILDARPMHQPGFAGEATGFFVVAAGTMGLTPTYNWSGAVSGSGQAANYTPSEFGNNNATVEVSVNGIVMGSTTVTQRVIELVVDIIEDVNQIQFLAEIKGDAVGTVNIYAGSDLLLSDQLIGATNLVFGVPEYYDNDGWTFEGDGELIEVSNTGSSGGTSGSSVQASSGRAAIGRSSTTPNPAWTILRWFVRFGAGLIGGGDPPKPKNEVEVLYKENKLLPDDDIEVVFKQKKKELIKDRENDVITFLAPAPSDYQNIFTLTRFDSFGQAITQQVQVGKTVDPTGSQIVTGWGGPRPVGGRKLRCSELKMICTVTPIGQARFASMQPLDCWFSAGIVGPAMNPLMESRKNGSVQIKGINRGLGAQAGDPYTLQWKGKTAIGDANRQLSEPEGPVWHIAAGDQNEFTDGFSLTVSAATAFPNE